MKSFMYLRVRINPFRCQVRYLGLLHAMHDVGGGTYASLYGLDDGALH
jgi:hypothetical protein